MLAGAGQLGLVGALAQGQAALAGPRKAGSPSRVTRPPEEGKGRGLCSLSPLAPAWCGRVLRQQIWRTDWERDTDVGAFGVAGPRQMGVAQLSAHGTPVSMWKMVPGLSENSLPPSFVL